MGLLVFGMPFLNVEGFFNPHWIRAQILCSGACCLCTIPVHFVHLTVDPFCRSLNLFLTFLFLYRVFPHSATQYNGWKTKKKDH
ncbi:hypothetical protein B0H11DRAFT_2022591, partial [Mycena galericulata]